MNYSQFQNIANSGNDLLVKPNYQLPNELVRNVDSIQPAEPYANRSILQSTINPYELISSTLHNNEFSPSANLRDLVQRSKTQASSSKKGMLHWDEEANSLDGFHYQLNNPEISELASQSPPSIPPPPPAVETIPLSIKLAPNVITRNSNMSKYSYIVQNFPVDNVFFVRMVSIR